MRTPLERVATVRRWAVVSLSLAASACAAPAGSSLQTIAGLAQGTTYSLQWAGGGAPTEVAAAAEDELERIDALLSNYRPDSVLEQFNAARTTEPLRLPGELVELLELAKRVHGASDGCFDPTVRPLVRAWGFDADAPSMPPSDALEAARASVGLAKLELPDGVHARKAVASLEVDMASIGQGYTAGRLAAVLEEHGSTAYLAEIGGEVVARGTKPDGSAWRIGIENPGGGTEPAAALRTRPEMQTAVITSGSYRHYLELQGRRLGHIIDPRSGWPVDHALQSVTVVGEDAATAAAWGTALLCLGPSGAVAAAERHGLAALFWIGGEDAPPRLEISGALAALQLLDEPSTR